MGTTTLSANDERPWQKRYLFWPKFGDTVLISNNINITIEQSNGNGQNLISTSVASTVFTIFIKHN